MIWRPLSIIFVHIEYRICTHINRILENKFVLCEVTTKAYIITYSDASSDHLATISPLDLISTFVVVVLYAAL